MIKWIVYTIFILLMVFLIVPFIGIHLIPWIKKKRGIVNKPAIM